VLKEELPCKYRLIMKRKTTLKLLAVGAEAEQSSTATAQQRYPPGWPQLPPIHYASGFQCYRQGGSGNMYWQQGRLDLNGSFRRDRWEFNPLRRPLSIGHLWGPKEVEASALLLQG
jgi:hypothetical protein